MLSRCYQSGSSLALLRRNSCVYPELGVNLVRVVPEDHFACMLIPMRRNEVYSEPIVNFNLLPIALSLHALHTKYLFFRLYCTVFCNVVRTAN